MANANSYQDHCVAFIDILGFRELVKRSEQDQAAFEQIRMALAENARWAQWYRGDKHELLRGTAVSSGFSDHVAITGDAADVINAASTFAFGLLQCGVFVRGGIAIGKVHHENGVIFGPALVGAYDLETRVAIYPRIIGSEDVVTLVHSQDDHDDFQPFRRDVDGVWFLDLLSPDWIGVDEETVGALFSQLNAVKNAIEENLQRYKSDAKIRAKTTWYAAYFNQSLLEHSSKLGPGAPSPVPI